MFQDNIFHIIIKNKLFLFSEGWPKSTVGSSGFAAAKVEWSGNRVEDLETVVATPVTIA